VLSGHRLDNVIQSICRCNMLPFMVVILLDFDYSCPLDPEVKNALAPGELNRMFERIVDGVVDDDSEVRSKDINTTVHSRPSYPLNAKPNEVDYILGPWVIIIDNFVSEAECERLKYLGAMEGYERSTNVGDATFDGNKGYRVDVSHKL